MYLIDLVSDCGIWQWQPSTATMMMTMMMNMIDDVTGWRNFIRIGTLDHVVHLLLPSLNIQINFFDMLSPLTICDPGVEWVHLAHRPSLSPLLGWISYLLHSRILGSQQTSWKIILAGMDPNVWSFDIQPGASSMTLINSLINSMEALISTALITFHMGFYLGGQFTLDELID